MNRKTTRMMMLTLFLASMLFTAVESAISPIDSIVLEDVTTWYWAHDTYITSAAVGDVDGDGATEIVTGGWYYDGTRSSAQLAVWNGATLALEAAKTWYWVDSTHIDSVAVGDVDGDSAMEIITGGDYWDGTRLWAQLVVWDGATLALEDVETWFWVDDTRISSVAYADVDGEGDVEIVTGGWYYDGTRSSAQLAIWDGVTLALESVRSWFWGDDTQIDSVAVGDVDGDGSIEIITGGDYYDFMGNSAQLTVWDGASLALEGVTAWHWGEDTYLESVAIGEADGTGGVEIVTGGWYYDGTGHIAQLVVWDGASLALEGVKTWEWGDTEIKSVAIGEADGTGGVEIVTGGDYDDGTSSWAQLAVWDGASLALEAAKTWSWGLGAYINSVAIGDVDGDGSVEIVTGGEWFDDTKYWAQLAVWTKT